MFRRLLSILLGTGAPGTQALGSEPVARVSALASGQLLLDGQPVSLQALDIALKDLKEKQGIVWYYRQDPDHESPPQATEAMGLVVKHQLRISMSTKADFSDVVDADGKSNPR
ncbi:MAG: hypothetical protein R3F24_00190 [Gammaproteobacteria bacterium]